MGDERIAKQVYKGRVNKRRNEGRPIKNIMAECCVKVPG
jgi:hypothetical protein